MMPSSNKTPELGLNYWAWEDKPKMDDFNTDNLITDSKISALAFQLAGKPDLSVAGATGWDSGNLPVETGTWTPTLIGTATAGAVTTTVAHGSYYRIGSLVYCKTELSGITISGAPAGQVVLTGLPFTILASSGHTGISLSRVAGFSLPAGALNLSGYIARVNSNIYLCYLTSTASAYSNLAWTTHLAAANNTDFHLSGSFAYTTNI